MALIFRMLGASKVGLLLAALFLGASARGRMGEHAKLAAWSAELHGHGSTKETPIQRVVKLLQEMKAQLESDATKDQQAYDKMVCWCETNEKEKTQAIDEADAKITALQGDVESMSARRSELQTKIEQLKEDLAKQKKSLTDATAIREKELAAFSSEEKDMVEAVTMLKNAIAVLSRHQEGLLQLSPEVKESVGAALRWLALRHEEMLTTASVEGTSLRGGAKKSLVSLVALATKGQRSQAQTSAAGALVAEALEEHRAVEIPVDFAAKLLAHAAAASAPSFAQQPVYQSYAPQSSQIFGILKQMQEDFESNLSKSQKEELKAREDFETLKASAEKEIAANTKGLDEMEDERATAAKALSDAKESLGDTREVRAEDVKFLSDLNLKCKDLDRQYAQRTEDRHTEIKAVAETIAILTADESRDAFHKNMGIGFFQLVSSEEARRLAKGRAVALLMGTARSLSRGSGLVGDAQAWRLGENVPHQQLSAMAVSVQLDAFTKVKAAIDEMVANLKSQQDEEVKQKAYCTKGFNDNEKKTYTTEQELGDLQDKAKTIEENIEKLTTRIAAAKDEIARAEVELKRAGEARHEENEAFQEEVNDQRAMQNILRKAIDRMRQVYKQAGLLQREDPQPPAHFQSYKQNAGASPVIGMMEQIVEDSVSSEKASIAAENEAQAAYETFARDTNDAIKSLNQEIETKTDAKVQANADLVNTKEQVSDTEDRLEYLGEVASDLHKECDFVLNNFEVRQRARLQEIEALQGAKAYLSGMED